MVENPRSNEGLCVTVCTLEAPQPLASVLRAVDSSARLNVQTEVLIVHGEEVQPQVAAILYELAPRLSVQSLIVDSRGFSTDRRSALDWVGNHRRGWSVLFLDDDDVPEPDLMRLLWAAHLEKPGDIVAGTVLGKGRPEPVGMVGIRPVKYHGASTMLIPGELIRECVSWLPLWVNHCGGEDTALCAEAGKSGVRIWEVSGAVAHEVKPDINGFVGYHARRALHDAWVFSSLCRAGVIRGGRASLAGRLASAGWNMLLATTFVLRNRHSTAKLYLARGVGMVCGLLMTPPPRTWLYETVPTSGA